MIGVDHVAWEYGSIRDLLENYAELKSADIEPYWAVNHGMSASLYYADPDGNQMELTVDCFAEKADCSAYFKGDAIGANPVGAEYDPGEWLAQLRAGASEADLLAIDPAAGVSPIRGGNDGRAGAMIAFAAPSAIIHDIHHPNTWPV